MRNRRLALAAALLLAITSADGAALAVSGADFSSEEVAEAVFDEVENEGLDNQDEVQEPVQTPEMDQVEDQSSEDSFSDASGMEAAAEWQNEEAATADEALVFSDGEEALEMIRNSRPDIILLDLNIPRVSGLEILEFLKKEEMQTRVIVVSCQEEFDVVKKAMKLGASDYISKPVQPDFAISPAQARELTLFRNEIQSAFWVRLGRMLVQTGP